MIDTPRHIRIISLFSILFISILIFSSTTISGTIDTGVEVAPQEFKYQISNAPALSAHAFLVRFVGEERPLIKQREDKRLAPASLNKILTAVLALEHLSPEDIIIFSEDSKKVEEKTSTVKTGDAISRDDTIRLAIVGSANDAALALAETVGYKLSGSNSSSSIETFVNLMNRKAEEIELSNSRFVNPTGLDAPDQYVVAKDLAKIAEYIWYNHRIIWEMSRAADITVVSTGNIAYNMTNTNDLLQEFPGIMGSKTGSTDAAKENLLLLYPVFPDKTAVIVILGSENRVEDGRKIIQWLEENFK